MSGKVIAGSIVRNRGWILPKSLAALKAQTHPVELMYLENDSTDNTLQVLMDAGATVHKYDTGRPFRDRTHSNNDYYQHLAELWNKYIDRFLDTDADYWFMCDSDVEVESRCVERLLELDDADAAAPLVCLTPAGTVVACAIFGQRPDSEQWVWRPEHLCRWEDIAPLRSYEPGEIDWFKDFPAHVSEPFYADITGGNVLFNRYVFEECFCDFSPFSAEFMGQHRDELEQRAFYMRFANSKLDLVMHPGIRTAHWMTEGEPPWVWNPQKRKLERGYL